MLRTASNSRALKTAPKIAVIKVSGSIAILSRNLGKAPSVARVYCNVQSHEPRTLNPFQPQGHTIANRDALDRHCLWSRRKTLRTELPAIERLQKERGFWKRLRRL